MSNKLIWIGSGSATEPAINFAGYDDVILVDAREDALEESSVKLSGSVHFINKLINVSNKDLPFMILNIEELSSVKTPTGLKELFPNIRTEDTIYPATLSLSELLLEVELDGSNNTLIIDTPCFAEEFVESLVKSGQLSHFSILYIRTGHNPLYDNSATSSDIKAHLEKQFYEGSEVSGTDPDMPFIRFVFNQNLAQNNELKKALSIAEAKLKQASELEQRLNIELEQTLSSLEEKTVAVCEAQQANKNYVDEIEALKSRVKKFENENKALSKAEAKFKQASELEQRLNIELEQTRSSLEEKTVAVCEAQQANKNYVDEIEALKSRVKKFENENKALSTVEAKLKQAGEVEQRLNIELEQTLSSLEEKTVAIREAQQANRNYLEEINVFKVRVQELENENNELRLKSEEVDKLRDLLASKDDQLAKLKRNADTRLAEMQARGEELEQISEQVASLTMALEAANKQITEKELVAKSTLEDFENKLKKERQIAQEASAQVEELDAKYKEVYSWFSSRKKQCEELQLKVEQLTRENETLSAAASTAKALADIEAKMTALFETQRSESVEIANALGQHVTKCSETAREDLLAAQELKKLPSFQTAPIATSPYAMQASNLVHLASVIRSNPYDVIIEFGSGVSTVLIADVLSQKVNSDFGSNSKTLRLTNEEQERSISGLRTTNPLPNYLVTFEQSSRFLQQTTSRLQEQNLEELVDVCLAPLLVSKYTSEVNSSALFYDCNEKLLELKRIFTGRKARVLVVIDGPDIEGKDTSARYAAVPTVLDYLSSHELTFFLGDSNRSVEQDVITKWKRDIKNRQLNMSEEVIHSNSGAYIIRVYP